MNFAQSNWESCVFVLLVPRKNCRSCEAAAEVSVRHFAIILLRRYLCALFLLASFAIVDGREVTCILSRFVIIWSLCLAQTVYWMHFCDLTAPLSINIRCLHLKHCDRNLFTQLMLCVDLQFAFFYQIVQFFPCHRCNVNLCSRKCKLNVVQPNRQCYVFFSWFITDWLNGSQSLTMPAA
jgi:hypothetical protein